MFVQKGITNTHQPQKDQPVPGIYATTKSSDD